jgi:hypothetical protein
MDILHKYPELAKIQGLVARDTETGLLSLDEQLYQNYMQNLQNQSIIFNAASLSLQDEVNRRKTNKKFRDIKTASESVGKISNSYSPGSNILENNNNQEVKLSDAQ